MDQKLCDTPVTGQFIAENLKKSFGPNAILKSIKDAQRIGVGQGYASFVLRLELEWDKNQEALPKSVIVKVPAVESLHKLMEGKAQGDAAEQMKAMMAEVVSEFHTCECHFFNFMGDRPPILMPKCYAALPVTEKSPGMIVLEDLGSRAATPPSFIKGLKLPQILAAVKEVARLHAWSLTTQVDWRSKIPKMEDREALGRQFLGSLALGIKVTKEHFPEDFGSIDEERLGRHLSYEAFEKVMTAHRDIMDDVLIHGDFHIMNLMFKKKSDGTVGDELVALIDFQGCLQGSPAFDVGRIMALSVCHKIRREHIDEIVHCYYDEVKAIAGAKFNASFHQYRALYDQVFALMNLTMVASIPAFIQVMVKSEGDEKIKDTKKVLGRARFNFEDASKILDVA